MTFSDVMDSNLALKDLDMDSSTPKLIFLPSSVKARPEEEKVVYSLSLWKPLVAVIFCHTVPETVDPQAVSEDLTVRFRVGSVMQNRMVSVLFDGDRVLKKRRQILAPGEMEQVVLPREAFDRHPNLTDLAICIEEA